MLQLELKLMLRSIVVQLNRRGYTLRSREFLLILYSILNFV
jgi:hypothetical protein